MKNKTWHTLNERERSFVRNTLKKVSHRPDQEKQAIALDFCNVVLTSKQIKEVQNETNQQTKKETL
ncbi:MAG: hypothetical protein H8E05_00645 [Bacteroidetes bacterium]|nr:hypothetical protein [Bacteroidota bacterium]